MRELLAQACTRQRSGWDSNPRPPDHESDALSCRDTYYKLSRSVRHDKHCNWQLAHLSKNVIS